MDCTRQINNTAASECPEQMDVIKVNIVYDDKAEIEYTGSTDSALTTFLQTGIHAATKLTRAFPWGIAYDLEDQNEDPKFQTSNIGVTAYAGEGAKGYLHSYHQDMRQLRRFVSSNGLVVKSFLVDQKKQVWGLPTQNGFEPVEMMVTSYNGKHKTNEVPVMHSKFDYVNPEDYNNLRLLGTLTSSLSTLKGLADVTLENVGTATAPKIKLFIDGTDVTSRYSTLLAKKEAWLYNGTTPASNPVYSSTDVAFTTWGTTAAAGVLKLVDPAVLHALTVPVNNIEGTPLTLA